MPITEAILYNPLIISRFIGLFLNISNIGITDLIGDVLEVVGRVALPIGLLTRGSALKIRERKQCLGSIFYATFMQFVIKSLLASLLVVWMGLSDVEAAVIIIAFIVPAASSSYILSKQLGGDAKAMATIITIQTIIAFIAIPILGGLLL